jgi:hypothetical protein
MAFNATIGESKDVEDGYVIDVTIRQTEDEQYPSGWDYGLHLGEIGGNMTLRYDNAHQRTNGHERHTRGDVEITNFRACWRCTTASNVKLKN